MTEERSAVNSEQLSDNGSTFHCSQDGASPQIDLWKKEKLFRLKIPAHSFMGINW